MSSPVMLFACKSNNITGLLIDRIISRNSRAENCASDCTPRSGVGLIGSTSTRKSLPAGKRIVYVVLQTVGGVRHVFLRPNPQLAAFLVRQSPGNLSRRAQNQ